MTVFLEISEQISGHQGLGWAEGCGPGYKGQHEGSLW